VNRVARWLLLSRAHGLYVDADPAGVFTARAVVDDMAARAGGVQPHVFAKGVGEAPDVAIEQLSDELGRIAGELLQADG